MQKLLYLLTFIVSMGLVYYFSQFTIKTTTYNIKTNKPLKKPIKILQISDLHDNCFGKEQSKLVNIAKKENPDIIVFTGDMTNKGRYYNSLMLGGRLSLHWPVYYVTGNHEHYMKKDDLNFMLNEFERVGVNVINNSLTKLDEYGVALIGLQGDKNSLNRVESVFNLATMMTEPSFFNLVLAHEPQHFERFVDKKTDIDLVLSGHAHGGQWVIPLVRQGIYAPDQGMFPKYTEGLHSYKLSKMIVSRGVGTMIKIPRIFNRPEVTAITLNNKC